MMVLLLLSVVMYIWFKLYDFATDLVPLTGPAQAPAVAPELPPTSQSTAPQAAAAERSTATTSTTSATTSDIEQPAGNTTSDQITNTNRYAKFDDCTMLDELSSSDLASSCNVFLKL